MWNEIVISATLGIPGGAMEALTGSVQTGSSGHGDVGWSGHRVLQQAMTPWSFPSMLVGFHVIQGVLAVVDPPQGTQLPKVFTPHTSGSPMTVGTLPRVLVRNVDVKKILPRRKNLKTHRLMKKMGKDFDNFWMSHEIPTDYLKILTKRNMDSSLHSKMTSMDLPNIAKDMFSILQQQNINDSNGNNNKTGNESDSNTNTSMSDSFDKSAQTITNVVEELQSWLVRVASCPVYYKWEDLGLLSWPRWIRQGMCSLKDRGNPILQDWKLSDDSPSEKSFCSWPPGMHCVPAKSKKLKILRWTCRHSKWSNWFDKFTLSEKHKVVMGLGMPPRYILANNPHRDRDNDMMSSVLVHEDGLDHYRESNHHRDDHGDDQHQSEGFHGNVPDKNNNSMSETYKPLSRKPLNIKRFESNAQSNARHESKSTVFLSSPDWSISSKQLLDKSKKAPKIPRNNRRLLPRRSRRDSATGRNSDADKKNNNNNGNNNHHKTDRHGKAKRKGKGKKKKFGFKCRWVKSVVHVTDDCYCSC